MIKCWTTQTSMLGQIFNPTFNLYLANVFLARFLILHNFTLFSYNIWKLNNFTSMQFSFTSPSSVTSRFTIWPDTCDSKRWVGLQNKSFGELSQLPSFCQTNNCMDCSIIPRSSFQLKIRRKSAAFSRDCNFQIFLTWGLLSDSRGRNFRYANISMRSCCNTKCNLIQIQVHTY